MNSTIKSVGALSETVNVDLHALTMTVTASLAGFDKTTGEISTLVTQISKDLADANLSQKSTEMGNALKRLQSTLSQAEALTRTTKNSLPTTLENLRVMSENLREFSEMAKRDPSQILVGQPPSAVQR
jgi:ABC-type transporter Mla subunit MlaD